MKTALEWLIEQLPKGDFDHQKIVIAQAMEMEKKQIEEFAIEVLEFYHNNLFMIPLKDGEAKNILEIYKKTL